MNELNWSLIFSKTVSLIWTSVAKLEFWVLDDSITNKAALKSAKCESDIIR